MRAAALLCAAACAALASAQSPEQVHLSFTGNMTSMHVSWVTVGSTKTSTAVKYGTSKSSLTKTANASSYTYTSGMTTPITIMDADMTGLEANTKYYYAVGDSDTVYNFTAAPTRSGGNVYAVLADFGVVNDVSLKQLITEAQHDLFDAVIHAGDFAYDLDDNGGQLGNDFMNNIMPVSSLYPYMPVVGNHEYASNFSAWKTRFYGVSVAGYASGSKTNLYYSWNDGLVHFVGIDTEMSWTGQPASEIAAQNAWLAKDLAAVDRSKTPWLIAFGHKQGWMDNVNFTITAEILNKYSVDLYICGHQHNYQRLLPQYNNVVEKCYNADYSVYTDCKDMTTVVVGSPGCRENTTNGQAPDGMAKFTQAYGYGHVTVVNATALQFTWEQTLAWDTQGKLVATPQRDENGVFTPRAGAFSDEFWIVKSAGRA
jgi:hypothetical protein